MLDDLLNEIDNKKIDLSFDNFEDDDFIKDDKIIVQNEDLSDDFDDEEDVIINKIEESVIIEDKPKKKVDIARALYDNGIKTGLVRKQIIELFINEAGLTKAGAATYYNNFQSKK